MKRNSTFVLSAGLLVAAAFAAATAPYAPAGFLEIPSQVRLDSVSAVACGPKGVIYVLHRGEPPLLAFDSEGKYLRGWGDGMFKVAHGLRLDRDGNIWTTDNALHVVREFSPDGKVLRTLGEQGVAGADETHFRSPDDLVFSSTGDIYVADAGNGRIVHLGPDGSWRGAWGHKGKPGTLHGPSEFAAAHGLAIDGQDRIYVADRGNNRVQVFDRDGTFLAAWTGFGNPFGLLVVGKELLVSDGDAHRISHLALETGGIVTQWGNPEMLKLPHLMSTDRTGNLYISEVAGKRIQKFRPANK